MIIFSCKNFHSEEKLSFKPDFIELRLDYHANQFFIPESYYGKKVIITLREKTEGGFYQGTLEQKFILFRKILLETDFFVDIEISLLEKFQNFIRIEEFSKRLILSKHENTEFSFLSFQNLVNRLNCNLNCFFYKFVCTIDSFYDLIRTHNFLKTKFVNYSLISTGKMSFYSRVLFKHFGSKATYFALNNELTAQNQITESSVLRYRLCDISKNTLLGGIVGGDQVKDSIGIDYYNDFFAYRNLDAVYIPFTIENIDDFHYFLNNTNSLFYGFSITMPFKNEFATIIRADKKSINLYLPEINYSDLTDIYAFEKAFKRFEINQKTDIFLLGSGAMAMTVINLLQENQIYLYARNEKKVVEICESYKNVQIYTKGIFENDICLINTLPINISDDFFDEKLHLNKIQFVIDLLYYKDIETNLIRLCLKYQIPFINGREFWEYQAEEQLKKFDEQILMLSS